MMKVISKFAKLIILLIIIVFALLLLLPTFIDQNALKSNLQTALDQKFDGDFTIEGKVAIGFFPTPSITIEKPLLKNAIYDGNSVTVSMQKMVVKVSTISLFSNIKINDVKLFSPVMELQFLGTDGKLPLEENKGAEAAPSASPKTNEVSKKIAVESTKWLNKAFDFVKQEDIFNLSKISDIEVENGNFRKLGLGGEKEVILDIGNINFVSEYGVSSHNLDISGNLLFNDIPTQFDLSMDVGKNEDSELIINSPIIQLQMEGQFTDANINDLIRSSFVGKIQADIMNPKEFFNKYFSTYVLIHGKVNTITPVKINAEIQSTKGNYKVSNIEIDSQILSGVGNIDADFTNPASSIINSTIDIENADIDSLWSSRFVGHSQEIIDLEKSIMEEFLGSGLNADLNKTVIVKKDDLDKKSLFNNLKLNSKFKIRKAKYLEEFLSDVEITLAVGDNGNLQIKNSKMKMPDGGVAEITGSFQTSRNVSNFVGSYKVSGKDFAKFISWFKLRSKNMNIAPNQAYSINGEIMSLPSFLALKDITINVANGKNIFHGDVRCDNSKDVQNVDMRLDVNQFSFADYFANSIERNIYLAPGELSKKLLWLNTISSENDINLNIAKFQFNNHVFLNQNFNFKIAPGVLQITDLNLKSEDGEIDFKLSFSADLRLNPKLLFDLEINDFIYKTGDMEDNKKYARLPFYARFFLLPTLVDFDGQVNLKSKKFTINNAEFTDVVLSGPVDDGVWNIKDGVFKIYNGDFKYNGEIVLRSVKSINGSFIIANINNNPLLTDLLDFKTIGGVSNISGIFNAHGEDLKSFVQSIESKLQFVSANVGVEGFGMSELLKRMLMISYSKADLSDPGSILFNDDYNTSFNEVKGIIELSPSKNLNQIKIVASSLGVNNVTNGSIDLYDQSFNGLSQIIFLTGTRAKQTPIKIAISHKGKFLGLGQAPNLDQVNQYITAISNSQSQQE